MDRGQAAEKTQKIQVRRHHLWEAVQDWSNYEIDSRGLGEARQNRSYHDYITKAIDNTEPVNCADHNISDQPSPAKEVRDSESNDGLRQDTNTSVKMYPCLSPK